MGNFEKLSVLVIVVIIVMILVVALYTWTEKPSEDGTSADTDSSALPVMSSDAPSGDYPIPDPVPDDPEIATDPSDIEDPQGSGDIPIEMPEIDPSVGEDPVVVKDPAEDVVADTGPWVYTVKKGDVFSVVCNRELGGYYKHLPALKQLNPGMDFDHIQIGQVVNMPPRGGATPGPGEAIASEGTGPSGGEGGTPGGETVVRQGESLKDIAKRVYGDWTLWTRIYAKNLTKISNPEYPTPGTRLTLPTR